MSFANLREEVCTVIRDLSRLGLTKMVNGNASGFHRESGCVLIKPSGIDVGSLTPAMLVVTDIGGARIPADDVPDGISSELRPSVDLSHHLGLYRADASIGGVVHTHSPYATAWAATGKSIPCAITSMADEFGGDIPCAPYCDNAAGLTAATILAHRGRGPAILLERHGVMTFARTPTAALKAAVMAEVSAQTVWIASTLGPVTAMPPEEIEKWWHRYQNAYGQVR